jgi:hypothetical protein
MLAVGLSGCIGDSQDLATGSDDQPGGPVAFDDSTGAIQGMVQTDELLPIEGAQVGTQDASLLASTGENGAFGLSNVEPGDYQIIAQALGYEASAQRVSVVAGSATDVNFVLDPLPTDEPYVHLEVNIVVLEAYMWKLTPECIYTEIDPLVKTCGGVRRTCDGECEKHYDEDVVTDEWKTFMAEIAWEPQTGATGRGFHLDLNAPNVTRGGGGSINQASPYTWQTASDQSPIVHRVDNPDTLLEREIPESDWYVYEDDDCTAPDPDDVGNCDWFYRVFAAACDLGICPDGFGPDFGVMVDGRATVYVSIFIKEPAEPGYTALPDA